MEVWESDSETARLGQQPVDEAGQRRLLDIADDRGATPAPQFHQPLVPQFAVAAQDGVDVDVELLGEVAGGRQTLADAHLTVCDGPPHCGSDPLVERAVVGGES